MASAALTQRTILVVMTDPAAAAPLQNQIMQSGGRVLIAALADALIDYTFDGADEVADVLRERRVPYIFCSAESLNGLSQCHGALPSSSSADHRGAMEALSPQGVDPLRLFNADWRARQLCFGMRFMASHDGPAQRYTGSQ